MTERRPATLKDIAARAGVSLATASKALNGRQHVRAETRERVQRAAEELHFSPNTQAQGLFAGRTGTVGLITSDLDGRFSIPILMGAEDAFGVGSMSVFLCDARGDAIREQHHLRALLSRRVDGIIVLGDTANPRETIGRGLPVPVVYAYAPSTHPDDVSVVPDNVAAGALAADHLIACGRSRIAYISGDVAYLAARDRVQGAAKALRLAGLELLGGEAVYGAWSEVWGRGAIHAVLQRFPDVDAVLCGSDQIARGVLDVLHELGRAVPGEIAVIGHDNWEQLAVQARPPLTTIDMNLQEVGRLSARLLVEAIDGGAPSGTHYVPGRLVPRASTIPSA